MVGDGDFCTVNGPCAVGEGGCDSNQECEDELICQNTVGTDYGFPAHIDGCAARPLPDLGSNYFRTFARRCGAGEGDCDVQHECQAGLVCHNNVGEGEGDCHSNDECEVGIACRNDIGAGYGFLAFIDVCDPYSRQQQFLFGARAVWRG